MIVNDGTELPPGWATAELGSFSEVLGGGTPSRNNPRYFGGDIVWLTPTEIPKDSVSILTDSREHLTEEGLKESSARLIPERSILLTSRASIGYAAIAGTTLTTNQGFASFILPDEFEGKYLAWWFKAQKKRLEELAGGTTFKEISKATLKTLCVPIAPANEQRRIVEAIEQQFTRLDAGVTALKRAQAALKRYRAAVLKAAVEGKLTEAWRAAHPDVEPASELLERLLTERRAKWEADLRAKGKDPTKAKYEELKGPDTATLPGLPEGWCWATVGLMSNSVRYGSSAKTSTDASGIPVLRMGNIRDGMLHLDDLKYLPRDHSEFPDLLLEPGDLLFNRTNSAELVGKSAVYHGQPHPCSYASYLISVRMSFGCNADYLSHFLNSVHGRAWLASVVTQQVGQANVNGSKLQAMVFPLPPRSEQDQIMAEVEQRLSVISELEATVEVNLKRAERLRQSILERAFSGELVPQDPNDEPASVLLEHIRCERDKQSALLTEGKEPAIQQALIWKSQG